MVVELSQDVKVRKKGYWDYFCQRKCQKRAYFITFLKESALLIFTTKLSQPPTPPMVCLFPQASSSSSVVVEHLGNKEILLFMMFELVKLTIQGRW